MKARHLALAACVALLSIGSEGCVQLFAETPQGLKVGLAFGNQNNGPRPPAQPGQGAPAPRGNGGNGGGNGAGNGGNANGAGNNPAAPPAAAAPAGQNPARQIVQR